jgi:hypothetical protein
MVPLSEREIKVAVIDYLNRKNALQDGVVINEFPVANWSRRADLAVANGKLQAFEIKSDYDSLRRLDGQIALFATRFDKVVVVTTSRFLSAAVERLPPYVEIWEAFRDNGSIDLRIARRGQTREIKNRHILASYLQKPELVSLLRSSGIEANAALSRDEMEALLVGVPLVRLRSFVLDRLKQRYRRDQESPLLTRAKRAVPPTVGAPRIRDFRSAVKHSVPALNKGGRFEAFERKFGPLPVDMPTSVKPRKGPTPRSHRRDPPH